MLITLSSVEFCSVEEIKDGDKSVKDSTSFQGEGWLHILEEWEPAVYLSLTGEEWEPAVYLSLTGEEWEPVVYLSFTGEEWEAAREIKPAEFKEVMMMKSSC